MESWFSCWHWFIILYLPPSSFPLDMRNPFFIIYDNAMKNEKLTFMVKRPLQKLDIVLSPQVKTREEPKFPLCKCPYLNSEM